MPVTFSSYRLGPSQRVSNKTVPPPWDWLLRRENELGPRRSKSQIILAVLVPPLYVAVQAPALIVTLKLIFWRPQRDRLGKLSRAVFKRSGPLVISAKPVSTLEKEREAEFYLFLVVRHSTGTGRGVEPEKTRKNHIFRCENGIFSCFGRKSVFLCDVLCAHQRVSFCRCRRP